MQSLKKGIESISKEIHDTFAPSPPTMTSKAGVPIADPYNTLRLTPRGPVLLQDSQLFEKHAAFNRERVPERNVHAAGAGAFGYFELTKDMKEYTKASLFNEVGKRTPIFIRFSTVTKEKGFPDCARDPRGFAIRFYTEVGNYDLVCNNTPIFFVRDPLQFPDFIRSQRKNPVSDLVDMDAFWDFLSWVPESVHQLTILFSDRGTPYGYRNVNGYGTHTFLWVNETGEKFWIKYHFKSQDGIKNHSWEEAKRICGLDPDFAKRDLFNHIASGNEACWTAYVQIIPFEEAKTYKWDIFDCTKVVPHGDYPLIEFGRLVLNKNPDNYFQDVEQAAFNPASMVPGIQASPDPMLQARLFAYSDAGNYRVGINKHQIPVNRARVNVCEFGRDGFMRCDGNGVPGRPNFNPNSLNFPAPDPSAKEAPLSWSGIADRSTFETFTSPNHSHDDFEQCSNLYLLFSPKERDTLVHNLFEYMKGVTKRDILLRQCSIFYRVHSEYGTKLGKMLGIEESEIVEVLKKKN